MVNLLLVEGPDDVHALSRLLEKHSLTKLRNEKDKSINPLKLFFCDRLLDINHVADKGSVVSKFVTDLEFVNQQRPNAVGLVLDFDAPSETQANNRDDSVCEAIRRLQLDGYKWNLPEDFTKKTSVYAGVHYRN